MSRACWSGSNPSLLAVTGAAALAIASSAFASHAWSNYHWSRVSTLVIRVGDNVTPGWDNYLRAAAVDWTNAAPLDVAVVPGGTSRAVCDPTYGRVEACNAFYGATGWLGLGTVWSSNGHIVQGIVQLNDSYFSQARYNTFAWRRMVMCQEIGHTFGLDHQDVDYANLNLGSCMDYTRDPTGTLGTNGTRRNTRPNTHDLNQLGQIHGHQDGSQLSSTRTTGATAAAQLPPGERGRRLGQAPAGTSPREWGRAVAFTARGRPRVFVKDLGEGIEATTFVIWADEAQDGEHEH